MSESLSVNVIGLGYIGLPTSAIIAQAGYRVLGIDINPQVVAQLNQGNIHIQEPDLDGLVHHLVSCGQFKAATTPSPADIFMIAVPTPKHQDNSPDLTAVLQAIESIAPYLHPGNLIIIESTCPVGTTEQICAQLAELRPDLQLPTQEKNSTHNIHVAYCPERVLPGKILRELIDNDRVIGGMTKTCSEKALAFYQSFVEGQCYLTQARTAELTKLTENAYRDVNIAFANELSLIANELDIDVWELIHLANHHPRVNILQPGPGVGGHCISIDPCFIIHGAPHHTQLMQTARQVNLKKTETTIQQAAALIKQHPQSSIACLGLSFKPNVDDLRESPALAIVQRLSQQFENKFYVVEPHIEALPTPLGEHVHVELASLETALDKAQIVLILVNHRAFQSMATAMLADKEILNCVGLVF